MTPTRHIRHPDDPPYYNVHYYDAQTGAVVQETRTTFPTLCGDAVTTADELTHFGLNVESATCTACILVWFQNEAENQ